MGWSNWSVQSSSRSGYGKNWLNETNIKNAANAMSSKLKSAGYTYINIDAGWNADLNWVFHTDGNGIPNPDPNRFPNGIASVAAYVHGFGYCWLGSLASPRRNRFYSAESDNCHKRREENPAGQFLYVLCISNFACLYTPFWI